MIAGCSKTLVEQTELDLNGHSSFGNLIKIRFGWVMFQSRFCKKSYRIVHIQSSVKKNHTQTVISTIMLVVRARKIALGSILCHALSLLL